MTDPLAEPVRFIDQRTSSAPFLRKALRYLFPDHWSFLLGEVALYAFMVLIATGIYLALFYDPSTAKTVYHGSYTPLDGQIDERRVQIRARSLAQRQGGAADPPDAPLGGRRVHGRDRPAPDARVLHGCVSQTARADLDRRSTAPVHGPARGLSRLLAGRRSAVGHRPGDRLRRRALDPGDRRAARRSRSSVRRFQARPCSSPACTSRMCS